MSAFKKAIELGAKAVEFDVQMTKDNKLVLIHDYFLDRTTSGSGLVMETSYDSLCQYDAGKWFAAKFAHESVPLLEEVLDFLGKDIEIHIEIKKAFFEPRHYEWDVYQMVKEKGLLANTIFSSFNHECLKTISNYEGVRIGMLVASGMVGITNYMKDAGILGYSLNQGADFISQELIEEAHSKGLKVLSYTVNEKEIAQYFERMGVDGIFSNFPDLMNGL
jgi:glycerophosphoryl diester phosphodiesterase